MTAKEMKDLADKINNQIDKQKVGKTIDYFNQLITQEANKGNYQLRINDVFNKTDLSFAEMKYIEKFFIGGGFGFNIDPPAVMIVWS